MNRRRQSHASIDPETLWAEHCHVCQGWCGTMSRHPGHHQSIQGARCIALYTVKVALHGVLLHGCSHKARGLPLEQGITLPYERAVTFGSCPTDDVVSALIWQLDVLQIVIMSTEVYLNAILLHQCSTGSVKLILQSRTQDGAPVKVHSGTVIYSNSSHLCHLKMQYQADEGIAGAACMKSKQAGC